MEIRPILIGMERGRDEVNSVTNNSFDSKGIPEDEQNKDKKLIPELPHPHPRTLE